VKEETRHASPLRISTSRKKFFRKSTFNYSLGSVLLNSASERDSNTNWTSSPSRDPSAAPVAVAEHTLHARTTTRSLSVGEEPEQEESSEGPAARRAAGDHSAPAAATRRRRRSFASLTVDTSTAPAPAGDLSSASQEPRDSVAPRPPKRAKLTRSTILESAKGVGNIPCCDLTSNGQFAAWTCLDGRLRVARIREHVQPGVALPPSVLNSTNHPLGFSSTSSTRGGLLQAPGRVTPSHTATSVAVQNGVTQPAANPSGPVSFPVEIREVVSSLSLEQFSTHQGHRSLLARAEREHLAGLGQHQQHLDRARQEEEDEQRRLEARTQALWLVQQAESLNANVSVVGGAPGVTVGDGGGTTEDDATDQETGSDNDAGRAQEQVSRGHRPSPSRNSLPLVREDHQGLPLPLSSSSSSSASSESCRPVDVAQLGGTTIPREGTTGTASSSSSQPPHGAAASVAASVAAVAAVDPTAAAVNNQMISASVGDAVRGSSNHAQLHSAGAVGAVSIAASGVARATSSGMFSPSSPSLHVHPSAYANLSQGPSGPAVLLGELRASDPLLQRNHSLNLAGLRRLIDWHWHVCFLDTSSVPATAEWKPLFDLDTTNSALSTYRNSYGGDNDHISFNHHDLAGSGGREQGMVGGMISRLGGQLSASIIGGPSSRGGSPGGRALSPSTARMLANSFDGTRTGTTQNVAGSTLYNYSGSTSSTDSDLRRRYWRLIRGFFQMPETTRSDDGSFLTSGRGSSAGAQHQASPGPVDADLHAGTVFASVGGGDESSPGGGGAPAAESQHLREVVHQFDRRSSGRSPSSQQHPQRTDDYLLQSTIIDWNKFPTSRRVFDWARRKRLRNNYYHVSIDPNANSRGSSKTASSYADPAGAGRNTSKEGNVKSPLSNSGDGCSCSQQEDLSSPDELLQKSDVLGEMITGSAAAPPTCEQLVLLRQARVAAAAVKSCSSSATPIFGAGSQKVQPTILSKSIFAFFDKRTCVGTLSGVCRAWREAVEERLASSVASLVVRPQPEYPPTTSCSMNSYSATSKSAFYNPNYALEENQLLGVVTGRQFRVYALEPVRACRFEYGIDKNEVMKLVLLEKQIANKIRFSLRVVVPLALSTSSPLETPGSFSALVTTSSSTSKGSLTFLLKPNPIYGVGSEAKLYVLRLRRIKYTLRYECEISEVKVNARRKPCVGVCCVEDKMYCVCTDGSLLAFDVS